MVKPFGKNKIYFITVDRYKYNFVPYVRDGIIKAIERFYVILTGQQ